MIEVWKDIKGFEGYYQVSNLGNVKALSRKVLSGRCVNHSYNTLREHLLSNGVGKYCQVHLSKNGKTIPKLVHRLVAEAFIPNPNNLPCINHKDENPKNNCVDNLEWCSYKYNNEYNDRLGKCKSKISNTLKGRKREYELTAEQRRNISEGAKRGWETRRRNMQKKNEEEIIN